MFRYLLLFVCGLIPLFGSLCGVGVFFYGWSLGFIVDSFGFSLFWHWRCVCRAGGFVIAAWVY